MKKDYSQNSEAIKTLSERNKIRKKISVYAGSATKEALLVLVREPVDNSIDEFNYLKENQPKNSFDTIKIKIDTKNISCQIRDYGRGIPYVKDKKGISTLEKTLTILHSGGKHENNSNFLLAKDINTAEKSNYTFSSGINGIGITLTNFASKNFIAVVFNEKHKEKAYMTFKNGYVENEATICKLNKKLPFLDENNNKDLKNGTLIIFSPSIKKDDFDDEEIFEPGSNFDKQTIIEQLKILPYLNPGLRIELTFDNELIIFDKEKEFDNILYKENKSKLILKKNIYFKEYMILALHRKDKTKKIFNINDFIKLPYEERIKYKIKTSIFEIAFNFLEENKEPLQENTVNSSIRIKGGKQDIIWKNQIKKIINDYIEENSTLKKRIGKLETEDIISSLTFIFMVKINEPSFAGQTKEKLDNTELLQFGNYFFKKYLNYWITRATKTEINKMLKVLETNKKARLKANQIKNNVFKEILNDNDNVLLMNTTKLTKCKSNKPELCELYLVEGDSAAGPCKNSRVAEYQAILPLKGKLINAFKVKNDTQILKNDEIINLITALGCKIGKDYDYSKLKYYKIIILSDKDIDGLHIRNLNEIFFYKYYKDLIEKGHVYIVDSPLFSIKTTRKTYYAWSIEERDKIINKIKGKYEVTRFKGLGEMNDEQLYDTCLDKQNRRLIQTTLKDFNNMSNEKLEELIHIYMDDRKEDVDKRKKLISEYYNNPRETIIDLQSPQN